MDPFFLEHSAVVDRVEINDDYILLGDGKNLKYVGRVANDKSGNIVDIMPLSKPIAYDEKTEVKIWRYPRRKPPCEKNVIYVTLHYPYISFVTFWILKSFSLMGKIYMKLKKGVTLQNDLGNKGHNTLRKMGVCRTKFS